MAAHTIRLREPWNRSLGASEAPRLSRKFGAPTGLGSLSRVYLAVGDMEALSGVFLNGSPLEALTEAKGVKRWDITDLLRPRNEVCLFMHQASSASGLEPLVRLEIEERESENG